MRIWLSLAVALMLGLASVAGANDASTEGIGGTPTLQRGEHRWVRMTHEVVRINVGGHVSPLIAADFWFYNAGPALTVTMGFPETAYGDFDGREYRYKSRFGSFASWVDGRRVRVRRVATRTESEWLEALWLKTVRFKRHQTRHVRVRYEGGGGADSSGYQWVAYNFTGGN